MSEILNTKRKKTKSEKIYDNDLKKVITQKMPIKKTEPEPVETL